MNKVISKDGTQIAFDRTGAGPPVILVDGALCSRASGPMGPLAAELAEHFTVFTYDRRGRGDSGETAPYDVEREVEDIAALIEEAGGSAYVYGISSGGALALEAAQSGLAIEKLAVYEVPYVVDDTRQPVPADALAHTEALIAADRRGKAVGYFMSKVVGLPVILTGTMRLMPAWSKLKAVAHTLPYDIAIMGGHQQGEPLPEGRWTAVAIPTLVADGGKSPEWIRNGTFALTEVLPGAHYRSLEGQTHMVKPEPLAAMLRDFFTS